jgi:predicted alpha/beta-fold hydrolase
VPPYSMKLFTDSSGPQSDSTIAEPISVNAAREFLARAASIFADKPFIAHRFFRSGHAQTLVAYAWPRRAGLQVQDQERLFEIRDDVKLLAHCRWQTDFKAAPTLLLWHGMEGSTESVYMLAIAKKSFRDGFNVVRVNLRNCGGTEHLTPTLYHGGLSEDLRAVTSELIEHDGLQRIFMIGYSLGGNLVLKLAGEYAGNPPRQVLGICAVSPSVDLSASANEIRRRSNWIYERDFLRRMRKRIYVKKKLYPHLYDVSKLKSIRTIRDFDENFTAVAHGFSGADEYYEKSSSIRLIDRIHIPTLIIHAKDDPFIPFGPLQSPALAANPYILFLATERGGHVAFVGEEPTSEDRFWAENRAVEFCRLGNEYFR